MDDTTTAPVSRADLRGRLEASLRDSTPATQALAAYFLSHLKDLPFDTAATVAVKTGLSAATVGRFCRALGYRNFKEVKAAIQADLGGKAWLIGERLREDLSARLLRVVRLANDADCFTLLEASDCAAAGAAMESRAGPRGGGA